MYGPLACVLLRTAALATPVRHEIYNSCKNIWPVLTSQDMPPAIQDWTKALQDWYLGPADGEDGSEEHMPRPPAWGILRPSSTTGLLPIGAAFEWTAPPYTDPDADSSSSESDSSTSSGVPVPKAEEQKEPAV